MLAAIKGTAQGMGYKIQPRQEEAASNFLIGRDVSHNRMWHIFVQFGASISSLQADNKDAPCAP